MGADIAQRWAEEYGYPFNDDWNLPAVMQYVGIKLKDFVTVKQRLARELGSMGEPPYEQPTQVHSLLARLPLKAYLTTNYDEFMSHALTRANRRPVSAIFPWYRGAEVDLDTSLPDGYEPHEERPLVYHLHGNLYRPASMVLAEQDYVEFLVNLATDIAADTPRRLPTQVLLAMTRKPLLFIGYSLRDWSFRMLFHGLIEAVPLVQQRRHISVQLAPGTGIAEPKAQRAQDYLTDYFAKLNITVYWGSAQAFCAELGRRLETR